MQVAKTTAQFWIYPYNSYERKIIMSETKQGSVWTVEDVKVLKKNFRNASNAQVGVILQRTTKSVERKAAKLGLTKTKKYLRSMGRTA